MCDCLKLTYHVIDDESAPITIEIFATGTLNGYNTYEFTVGDTTYYIWHDATNNWYVSTSIGVLPSVTGIKTNTDPCPIAEMPQWLPAGTFDVFTTEMCDGCTCINVTIQETNDSEILNFELDSIGEFNGMSVFEFTVGLTIYSIWFNGVFWQVTTDGVGGTANIALLRDAPLCPIGGVGEWVLTPFVYFFETKGCSCKKREDRHAQFFNSIKLPSTFKEQNRGLKDCCCKQMVLASNETESWKNDITSAWIKVSDELDTFNFVLYKDGQLASYTPTIQNFVNEQNAFYTTIEWRDVLASDGIGCYKLVIEYQISGISGTLEWGEYQLKQYSIQSALKTARIKAIFNGYQENEGIDFTGSNVVSTHRFFGFIGDRQPNAAIDNLIYNNREMKRNIRENLFDYMITTDPENECIISPMVELFLLSENELFISDYNAHNFSYKYLDLPVIVSESPAIEYKEFSRKAILTCKVEDKFKNKRTYYNG
jgi:hypothetical protein